MIRNLFSLILCSFILFGCAGWAQKNQENKVADTLLGTKATIVSLAVSADQLCSQGALTQVQCDKVASIYSQAKGTYDLAATTMELALESSEQSGWDAYVAYHTQFMDLYVSLIDYLATQGILETVEKGEVQ